MKTKREKFLELVSEDKNNTAEKNRELISNRGMYRISGRIAFWVLERIDDLGWDQAKLAQEMKVSPEFVNKLVRGKEDLKLSTIVKLQEVLNIEIFNKFYFSR